MNRFLHAQKGLSLVELMIAITLGLVLMAGVTQMFVSSKTVYSTQQNFSRIQETGRLAVEFLSRDLRSAGLYGCFRPNPSEVARALKDANLVIDNLYGNFGQFIRGYATNADLSTNEKNYVGKPITANTNVLVVRYAGPTPRIINAPSTGTTLQVYSTQAIDPSTNCVDGLCLNGAAVVSDCFRGRLFKVSNLSATGSNLTVSHPDWSSDMTSSFSSGEVLPMNAITYFISPGASGAPSLWQKTNLKPAVEILEGVEDIVYLFATTTDPVYKVPASITNWADVNSVRMFVVVRSVENNAVPSPQPYVVNGVTKTPGATDLYMRQVFTATVGLRSPVANE